MSLLRRRESAADLARTASSNPWMIPTNSSPHFTGAGVAVDDNTAMQLLAVYACVRVLSGTLSGMPLESLIKTAKSRKLADPQPDIIADPFGGANTLSGRGLTRKAGISQLLVSLLLRGNAYAFVVDTDKFGRPTLLQVLHPDAVTVYVDKETGVRTYTVNRNPVPASRIWHMTGLTMPGSAVGISVIQAAARAIGLGLAAEEYGARFFGAGAHLSGVIETEGDLDVDKARELAEGFMNRHSGIANAHKVGVLSGGAKFNPISVTPEDAQFLATRDMSKVEIAMLFGVPPHMIGAVDRTTSWGKGIEEQTLGFLKFTLADWAQRFEDGFTAMVPEDQIARFQYDELLRPDATTRWATYQIGRNTGALLIDEIRAAEGREPLPNDFGQDPFAPLNSAHTNSPGWTPDATIGSQVVDEDGDPIVAEPPSAQLAKAAKAKAKPPVTKPPPTPPTK